MTPAEIVAIVEALDPHAPDTWTRFARLIAAHCADLADEVCPDGQAGAQIRQLFRVPPPSDDEPHR